jgi:hypothetical protein
LQNGVASISVTTGGQYYSTLTSIVIGPPNLREGTQATAKVNVTTATGVIASITVVTTGTGYDQPPSLTLGNIGTGTGAVLTVQLSQPVLTGQIQASAWVVGGSSAKNADIIKQESGRRYLVETSDGMSTCHLTTTTVAVGYMSIIATDANTSTYYVSKLTNRKAYLWQKAVNGSFLFGSNKVAKWTLGAATTGTVSIAKN